MNAGVTSERIYDALKTRLLSGDILPGERLEPAAFAELLGSSATPVRDALHRLAGEHIVEMRPAEGFQLPFVTEPALRDLLAWNADLLRLALRRWPARRPADRANLMARDPGGGIRTLFGAIVARAGNVELDRHIEAASDRLATARVAETRVLSGTAGEMSEIRRAARTGDVKAIGRRVAAYHRRRVTSVPAIVQAIYRSG
jgi:DNA-binding transcriptional MocR family regulator